MDKSPDAFRTISEVAEWLETPTHVLRFWESRFTQVKPVKRAGGRRYYRPADMELLGGIKRLLHEDGMTIRGVQKLLRKEGVRHVAGLSAALNSENQTDGDVVQHVPETVEVAKPEPVAEASPPVIATPGDTPEVTETPASAPEPELTTTAEPQDTTEPDLMPEDDVQVGSSTTSLATADTPEPEPVAPTPTPAAEPEPVAAIKQAKPVLDPKPIIVDIPDDPDEDDTEVAGTEPEPDTVSQPTTQSEGAEPTIESLVDRLKSLRERMNDGGGS